MAIAWCTGHGSGGKLSAALLRERFLPHLGNPILDQLGDAAIQTLPTGEIALSTDTFVARPLEFPGGDISALAVHGTVNDLPGWGFSIRRCGQDHTGRSRAMQQSNTMLALHFRVRLPPAPSWVRFAPLGSAST
jgi:hypothetical protein